MRVAVIGSRELKVSNLGDYLPDETTVIVTGGAKGVDASARDYALKRGLSLKEFLPEYDKYGRLAPLMRNLEIIAYADLVLAFWDGISSGTAFVIRKCRKQGTASPGPVHSRQILILPLNMKPIN